MACNMPDPCRFPSLDRYQKRFPWSHKEGDLAPQPVIGLVLQVGYAESFLRHLVSKARILFFSRVSKQRPCFTAIEKDGSDKRLVQLELACESDGVASPEHV